MLVHVEFDRPELPWAFSAATVQEWAAPVADPHRRRARRGAPAPGDGGAAAHRGARRRTARPRPRQPVGARAGAAVDGAAHDADVARVREGEPLAPRVAARAARGHRLRRREVVPTTDAGCRGGAGSAAARWGLRGRRAATRPCCCPCVRLVGVPHRPGRQPRADRPAGWRASSPRTRSACASSNASEPGRPLTPLSDGELKAQQVLRCALFSPTPPSPAQATAETASWSQEKTDELRAARSAGGARGRARTPRRRARSSRHRAAALRQGAPRREHGRRRGLVRRAQPLPMHRIAAGSGTRVMQRDQSS